MAQVPNYGGPQVMPSILGYRPMSTEIPKVPEMDVQKPLAKASAKLDDWYSKFLAEQDDARVTEALTELRRKAIDMESGEGGWASTLGANALEPDLDGKGLVERMDSGLQDYGQELASGLTARQQKMFGEKAQAIYTASYSGVSQHVYQQAIAQKKAAHEGAIAQAVESGAAYAGKPDMLAQSAHAIHESADKLAEFMGWTAENKALYIKKNMSSMYMNGIDALLAGADRNPTVAYQALGLLRAHSKEMLGSDVARARQRINPIVQAHEDRLKIERYVAGLGSAGEVLRGGLSEAVQRGVVTQDFVKTARGYDALTSITSDGGHQSVTTKEGAPAEWKHGASQLTVEQGMEAAKAANQPWDPEAFKTDRNYNDMLGVARYNDMLTEFADEHMAMAGYITSKETVREAEKQAQEKGGVWTDYLPEKAQSTLKSAVANMRREEHDVNIRRDGTREPIKRHKPTSFEATGPNQVWSWDITYLKDANHQQRFYYVFAIVDIYSRYVVHANVFDSESAENAVKFLEDAIRKHHIKPRALVLHSDNGAAMKAASTLALLARYKVEPSHSRPRVSNDNPYSESLFKTMKYRGYMGKRQYRSLGDAKTKLAEFVKKYNEEWVHSGINNVTPESRFKAYDGCIQDHRRLVLLQARERNPNRWISGVVRQFQMAGSQFLNPDRPSRLIGSSPEGQLMEGTRNCGEQAVHWPKAA